MAKIRFFLIFMFILILSVPFVIGLIYIFKDNAWKIRRYWSKYHLKLMGIDIKEIGKADLECKMILINHQSLIDILALESIYKKDLVWVAKKEVANIPLYGHIAKAPK